MNLRKGSHCTYSLTYHLVLVVKYRKPCIDEEIAALIKEKTAAVLEGNCGSLIEANSDKDHIHLVIEVGPGNNLTGGCDQRHYFPLYKKRLSTEDFTVFMG